MKTKSFHLGDVISITTGIMMSPRLIEGVYDILNFMTADSLYTHQLPRAARECKPYLLEQFPQLNAIVLDGVTPGTHLSLLESLCAEYGEYLMVASLPKDAHEFIDPMSELVEQVHPSKIITVKLP